MKFQILLPLKTKIIPKFKDFVFSFHNIIIIIPKLDTEILLNEILKLEIMIESFLPPIQKISADTILSDIG